MTSNPGGLMGYRGAEWVQNKTFTGVFVSIKTNTFLKIKQIIFLFGLAPKIKNSKNKNIRLSNKIYILNNFIII